MGRIRSTFYIVTGRIPYDDEDSLYVIEAQDESEAVEGFKTRLFQDGEATEYEDGEPCYYVNYLVKIVAKQQPRILWTPS